MMKSPSDLDYSTADYELQVGVSHFDTGCKGEPCYKLVCTTTGVVEGESISLPDAIGSMVLRQESLNEARKYYNNGKLVSPSFLETQFEPEGDLH